MAEALTAPANPSLASPRPLATRAEIHRLIAPYARASSLHGYASFAADLALYVAGIAIVVLAEPVWAKVAGGVLAGMGVVNLGSLSHEAAHRALVKSKAGNKLLAVASLTLILFNYRLWIYDHHVLHHGKTNVKHNNFLSPLTQEEYLALPPLRRAIYRAYLSQSCLGILLYFLLERWPTVHYVPGAYLPARFRASAWGYAAVMTAWMAALLSVLVLVPQARGASVLASVLCGFALPYLTWFAIFSMTAFLQHTNPKLRWYGDMASLASHPESLSVHVGFPSWLNFLTHYVLEHPVHHVSAMIPHYHLRKAQAALADVASPPIIYMPFTLGNVRDVLRRCKLYDYRAHAWLDFDGNVTAVPLDTGRALRREGELAPYAGDDSAGVFFADAPVPQPAQREQA